LQKRLPKYGFTSRIGRVSDQVRTSDLSLVEGDTVDLLSLKQAGIVRQNILQAKIFLQGDVSRAVTVKGMRVSKGAKAAIEAAGGKVES